MVHHATRHLVLALQGFHVVQHQKHTKGKAPQIQHQCLQHRRLQVVRGAYRNFRPRRGEIEGSVRCNNCTHLVERLVQWLVSVKCLGSGHHATLSWQQQWIGEHIAQPCHLRVHRGLTER